jgi:hypothetical protein
VSRPLLVLALLVGAPAQAALIFEEGQARDPRSNELMYLEHHLIRREQDRPTARLVVYRCPDGTAFARKQVDYRNSVQAPEFSLEDARLDYGEGLRRSRGSETVWVRVGSGATERSAPLAEAAGLVADAGFDEFIRDNWQTLVSGQSVPLRFAVPSRLQAFGFRVASQGSAELDGEPIERFRLRLGGLLGWFAPHIDVAYGRDDRRLLRFEGLSNLRSDDGKSQLVARIVFPDPATAADDAKWQAMAREPLSACRVGAG